MRRASRTDTNQREIVEALRRYGCSVTPAHMVGNGFPDLVVGIHGRTGLLEVKTPQAGKSKDQGRTDDQKAWMNEWKGGPVGLVTDVDGALRFARQLAFGDPA